jgi:hypothetical protein
MDWADWALFGVVATTALTAVMIAAPMAGLTRLDLPLVLGTLVTANPDRARVAGSLSISALAWASPSATRPCSTWRTVPPGGSARCWASCTLPWL